MDAQTGYASASPYRCSHRRRHRWPAAGSVRILRLDSIECSSAVRDGQRVEVGHVVMRIKGQQSAPVRRTARRSTFYVYQEWLAPNPRFVDAIAETSARITDTRKRHPAGWHLQKWAVTGGGVNHRIGLYDAVLIKENHAAACGGVAEAVRRADCGRPARNRPAYLCRARDDTRGDEFDIIGPRSDHVG